VGGDFYDLFPLADGSWALVIGDVCGKGIEAAALTSVARHTIRAAAQHVDSPAGVLRWVHEAVLAFDPTTYCTACFGVLRLGPDGVPDRFEFALGGHAGPLLVSSDDDAPPRSIGVPGTLLGMISDPVIVDSVVDLHPGDMLFLYTDGFTDAPNGQALDLAELAALLADGRCSAPDQLADRIRLVLDHRRTVGAGDDTALMLVKVL
ncbi:MAG: Magnesium or manganese-dependent protein phosphatase, partial [Acidimicrobiia bacterium]|nr:Magnesium or manganese-dependent protein phosphatase [Acidimicrobiia bacterium]